MPPIVEALSMKRRIIMIIIRLHVNVTNESGAECVFLGRVDLEMGSGDAVIVRSCHRERE